MNRVIIWGIDDYNVLGLCVVNSVIMISIFFLSHIEALPIAPHKVDIAKNMLLPLQLKTDIII